MNINSEVSKRLRSMSAAQVRKVLYDITISVVTDCGNLPNGFGPEEQGNDRDSCASSMEELEGILSEAGLNVEGVGDPAEIEDIA